MARKRRKLWLAVPFVLLALGAALIVLPQRRDPDLPFLSRYKHEAHSTFTDEDGRFTEVFWVEADRAKIELAMEHLQELKTPPLKTPRYYSCNNIDTGENWSLAAGRQNFSKRPRPQELKAPVADAADWCTLVYQRPNMLGPLSKLQRMFDPNL